MSSPEITRPETIVTQHLREIVDKVKCGACGGKRTRKQPGLAHSLRWNTNLDAGAILKIESDVSRLVYGCLDLAQVLELPV